MQPSQILHAIRRNLVACLVILLVCILAGLGVALSTKPVAMATTTLGIQPKSKETPSFSTQAKDLMPTLVELSTSPKVLEPAAADLNMETTDLSDALTVTNPPETLVLSITAKASSKQKAVDMAQATADSLNKELTSGELLGKQALGMTTSTTSPATTANTTMERPGARAAAISGLLLGLLAAARPGRVQGLIMRTADFMLAYPAILTAIMLTAVFGAGLGNAIVAVGIYNIPSFVRITRAAAAGVWSREYAMAARACGLGPWQITWRHVLPNILPLLLVQATVRFAVAILAEAALSFLGFGVQPPQPSWGRMLADAQSVLFEAPLQALWPGLAIMLAVLGLNLLGDGLRDLLDPKLRRR